jgi:hypothetical protein
VPNIFSVNFTFEAADLEEAQEVVGTWVVSPGTVLTSLQGTINPVFRPTPVGMDGKVGTAVAAAQMKESSPVMAPAPPPQPPPPTLTPLTNGTEE